MISIVLLASKDKNKMHVSHTQVKIKAIIKLGKKAYRIYACCCAIECNAAFSVTKQYIKSNKVIVALTVLTSSEK